MRRFPPIPETAVPTVGTYKPTDTITLDIADSRVVIRKCLPGPDLPEKPVPPADLADFSNVQELRVRLMREGFYGEHEERQLRALARVVATGMTVDAFTAEVRQRFGPWPKPERDQKGRVVWTRREVGDLGLVIRGAVAGSPQAVMR
jgi:hypothetical protein